MTIESELNILEKFKKAWCLEVYFKSDKSSFEFGHISMETAGVNKSITWKNLFENLKIEPQKLRSVFHRKNIKVPHLFPYNYSWFGLNPETYYWEEIEIPDEISSYDELGYFKYTDEEAFIILAKILEKELDVYKFTDRSYSYEFRVYPSGKISPVVFT